MPPDGRRMDAGDDGGLVGGEKGARQESAHQFRLSLNLLTRSRLNSYLVSLWK